MYSFKTAYDVGTELLHGITNNSLTTKKTENDELNEKANSHPFKSFWILNLLIQIFIFFLEAFFIIYYPSYVLDVLFFHIFLTVSFFIILIVKKNRIKVLYPFYIPYKKQEEWYSEIDNWIETFETISQLNEENIQGHKKNRTDISEVKLIKDLSSSLFFLRKTMNYSREEVSTATGIPVRRLERLEIDETKNVLATEIIKLSMLYNTDILYFVDDNDPTNEFEKKVSEILFKSVKDKNFVNKKMSDLFLTILKDMKKMEERKKID